MIFWLSFWTVALLVEYQCEDEGALQTLRGFFRDRFSYSLWQGAPAITSTNETPLNRFLLQTRSGHCEYFATAAVLLLRLTCPIPIPPSVPPARVSGHPCAGCVATGLS